MSERTYLKYCDKLHDEVGFHASRCPLCSERRETGQGLPSLLAGVLLMTGVVFVVLFVVLGLPFYYTFDGVAHEVTLGRPR